MKKSAVLVTLAGALLITTSNAQVPEEKGLGNPYSPFPEDKVVVTKAKHYGMVSWKIAAAGGTWYFETGDDTKGSTGFHSAFDQAGNDWIGNDRDQSGFNTSPACKGWGRGARGFPQFAEDGFDHPQKTSGVSGKTKWTDGDGKALTFSDTLKGDHLVLHSFNAKNEVEYHFFVTHNAIKVVKAGVAYTFLWEGVIGGESEKDPKDYYVLKDGAKKGFIPDWSLPTSKFPNGQWNSPFFYMVDSDVKKTQVAYLGTKDLSSGHKDEGWQQTCDGNVLNQTIFGYGRSAGKRNLTGTSAVAVFGFLKKSESHDNISRFIEERLKEPFKGVPTTVSHNKISSVRNRAVVTVKPYYNKNSVVLVSYNPKSGSSVYRLDGRQLKMNVASGKNGLVIKNTIR